MKKADNNPAVSSVEAVPAEKVQINERPIIAEE